VPGYRQRVRVSFVVVVVVVDLESVLMLVELEANNIHDDIKIYNNIPCYFVLDSE
ncbi:MAG: hypothetical protein ACI90V_010772, partial [Bacillariaceae sp.]|jgi:hypothetical protein